MKDNNLIKLQSIRIKITKVEEQGDDFNKDALKTRPDKSKNIKNETTIEKKINYHKITTSKGRKYY